jgi:hypothetical protein
MATVRREIMMHERELATTARDVGPPDGEIATTGEDTAAIVADMGPRCEKIARGCRDVAMIDANEAMHDREIVPHEHELARRSADAPPYTRKTTSRFRRMPRVAQATRCGHPDALHARRQRIQSEL